MRRRFLLQAGLVLLLLLIVVVQVDRIMGRFGGDLLDLGDTAPGSLAPETVAFLRGLDQPLSITCFLTFGERLPPHLKDLEGSIRTLLTAMERQAPGLVTWRVIDPDLSGTAGAEYAARHRVSPIKVRRVVRDEGSEQTVWSSMVLALGDYPEVLIQDLQPAQLPRLEELIVAQLQALRAPPRPVFAVATPPGYDGLRGTLANYGEVVDLDLDSQPVIPTEADLLFWVQPARVTTENRRRLRQFVALGRSAVLAGSAYAVDCVGDDEGRPVWQTRALPQAWHDLLLPLGLTPAADLLLDRGTGPLTFPCGSVARTLEPPFALRCLPAFYNQRSFLGPARGGLSFSGASPLAVDPGRAAREGFEAEIVATTTDGARVVPLPEGRFTEENLRGGLPVPKQNLMVLLHPQDPGQGQILVLASPTLLQDGRLDDPAYAHPVFLRTLVRTFTEPRRLVWGRLEKGGPPPLAVPGGTGRLFWRLAASLAVPLALLILGLRRSRVAGPLSGGGTRRGSRRPAVAIAAILGIALLTGFIRRGPALDLSNDDLNTPAPLTRALLERDRNGLVAELISSPRADLPAPIRQAQERAADLLTGHGVPLQRLAPEGLAPEARQQLATQGLRPFVAEQVAHDSTSTRPVWSALRLQRGDASTVIPRLDGQTASHLDFLLAAALRRLEQGRTPRVALAADPPRLSPAEAMEDYQRQGLVAPTGADIFSRVAAILQDYGYRVEPVNPREPVLADRPEVLLWLQPRRDASRMTHLLGRYLASGGKGIVALQHYNIQQRQYRGAGFETVYWPQPQFQDLDPYLRLFGVEQVREVLMDRTRSHLDLETQVNRGAVREYDPQQVALPFLIRAVPEGYATDAAITRNLGDLLFVWGNRFNVDQPRLASAGLRSQVLVSTSSRAWAYPWQGGWLPAGAFRPDRLLPGPQPLVLLLQGPFPRTPVPPDLALSPGADASLGPGSTSEGALLLIGCSEMFRNEYLQAAGFAHDQLLLNAVAGLALGPELAELQGRHRAPRGFSFRSSAEKLAWRTICVWAGPLAFLLVGLGRWLAWRRGPRVAIPGNEAR